VIHVTLLRLANSLLTIETPAVLDLPQRAALLAHPIPTDLEAVKVLSCAPAGLDLFMWLCCRCFVSKSKHRDGGDLQLTGMCETQILGVLSCSQTVLWN
jgi:hypothetical protein